MDQIDFTGPFEVLSRMPDTTIQIIGQKVAPVRDVQGLRLSPDVRITEAGVFDVLLVPGGHGQQALMHDEDVTDLIRKHVQGERLLFSVRRARGEVALAALPLSVQGIDRSRRPPYVPPRWPRPLTTDRDACRLRQRCRPRTTCNRW
jgi:putative intracellular protease/amidase